jgi:hypothetical protein
MGILKSLFGKAEAPTKPYVENGRRLAYKLANSLGLVGWSGGISYTEKEQRAIENSRREVERDHANVRFHPEAGEVVTGIYRNYAASALKSLAQADWIMSASGTLPADWKERLSTYLKSWAADLSPFTMDAVAELLVLAGYKSEAKEAYRVLLEFPNYARNSGMGYDEPLQIVEDAPQHIAEL